MLKRYLRNISESHRDVRQRLLNLRYCAFTYVLKCTYTCLHALSMGAGRQTHTATLKSKRCPSEA